MIGGRVAVGVFVGRGDRVGLGVKVNVWLGVREGVDVGPFGVLVSIVGENIACDSGPDAEFSSDIPPGKSEPTWEQAVNTMDIIRQDRKSFVRIMVTQGVIIPQLKGLANYPKVWFFFMP